MKDEEKKELFKIKKRAGFCSEDAGIEVKNFIDTQKQFKVLGREYKKSLTKIKNLENELEKKNERIRKLSNKPQGKQMFMQDMVRETSRESKIEIKGSLRALRRIMHNMELGKLYTQTEISKEFILLSSEVKLCLMLLEELKFLRVAVRRNGVKLYERIS